MKFEKSDENYTQIRKKSGGGLVKLNFEVDKMYHVADVLKIAMEKFTSSYARNLFEKSKQKIGYSEDNLDVEIDEFCDYNGKKIGILEYFVLHDLWRRRKNLYVLCTATEKFWGAAGKIDLDDSCEDESEKENDESDLSSSSVSCTTSKNDRQLLKPQSDNFENISNKPKYQCLEINDSDSPKFETLQSENSKKKYELQISSEGEDNFITVSNNIYVSYWITGFSKYPPHSFFSHEGNSSEAFRDCSMNQVAGGPGCDEEDFDPRHYGYEISKIEVNDITVIQTWFDDQNDTQSEESRQHIQQQPSLENCYPNAKHRAHISDHNILFEIDEIVGSINGKIAIGIVPMCQKSCNPRFTWYKDEVLYEAGENLMILFNVPITNEASSWQCEIQCRTGPILISKKITLRIMESDANCNGPPKIVQGTSERTSSGDGYLKGVKIVTRDDFTVHKDRCIGRGQQSIVYEGTFGQLKVAVKTIKLYNAIPKDAYKEINILKSIDHKNFVFLHGVCIEKKLISILLEHVNGITLS